MKSILPKYGVSYNEVSRFGFAGVPVSSAWVRSLLREQRFTEIERLVPPATLAYLREVYVVPDWMANMHTPDIQTP